MRAKVSEPWKEWIPGVLSRNQIRQLCEAEVLIGNIKQESLDASALDLTLSDEAYQLTGGSVKPPSEARGTYSRFISRNGYAKVISPVRDGAYLLEKQKTYVFRLNEKLGRGIDDARIFGQATAKSSIGRVDVLARLIVDGMDTYERFGPTCVQHQDGGMYLEITPMTFNVLVREGCSLSQLRLCYGDFGDVEIRSELLYETVGAPNGCLTISLENELIGGLKAAAFSAVPKQDDAVPLWEDKTLQKKDPWRFWKLVPVGSDQRMKIEKDEFYLFKSKEEVNVPAGIAIYCRASDETIGEMRIHYAGFVHPFFGRRRDDGSIGTPLMFEVRGHQVDVSLAHGEKLANLVFFRMSEDAQEGPKSDYERQSLKLSKFFSNWPEKLKETDHGAVEPA